MYPPYLPALTNVTPFTYRDGTTYLEELQGLIDFINSSLIGQVNTEMGSILTQLNTALATATAHIDTTSVSWTTQFNAYMANVTASLQALNDHAAATLINTPASEMSVALTALFGSKTVQDSLNALTSTGRLSSTTLGGQFTGLQTQLDTLNTLVGTGRLSSTTLDGRFNALVPLSQKGAANGVATLGGDLLVPGVQLPAPSGRGTYLSRPAANTVRAGYTYTAYDVLETYYSDGTSWFLISHGGVFGSVQLGTKFDTANYGPSVGGADVPGMAVTFTAGTQRVKVTLAADLSNTYANAMTSAGLMLNGSFFGFFLNSWSDAVDSKWRSHSKSMLLPVLTPGSVNTVKVQLWTAINSGGHALMDGYDATTNPNGNASTLFVEGC
jgi:hypothetical protein